MDLRWQRTEERLVEVAVERGGERLRLRRTTDDGWRIESLYTLSDNELVLTELHITPSPVDPRSGQRIHSAIFASRLASWSSPITSRLLREVRLDEDRDLAKRLAPKHGVPLGSRGSPLDELDRLVERAVPVFRKMRTVEADHPGRRGRPDEYLAIIALVYVSMLTSKSPNPVRETAARLELAPEYVRDALHRARVRELLTRAPRGRAGGTLTPKALEVLQPLLERKQPSKRKR